MAKAKSSKKVAAAAAKSTPRKRIPKTKRDVVFNKAKKIRNKNPKIYRKDKSGNVIHKASYGKDSPMGWEIDHSKPLVKGGTDHLNNLQALQTEENRRKSDKYPYNYDNIKPTKRAKKTSASK